MDNASMVKERGSAGDLMGKAQLFRHFNRLWRHR
jgi:hypothetical protein